MWSDLFLLVTKVKSLDSRLQEIWSEYLRQKLQCAWITFTATEKCSWVWGGGIKYKKKERQKREDKEVEFKKIFFDLLLVLGKQKSGAETQTAPLHTNPLSPPRIHIQQNSNTLWYLWPVLPSHLKINKSHFPRFLNMRMKTRVIIVSHHSCK